MVHIVSVVLFAGSVIQLVNAGWKGWDKNLDWWQDSIIYQIYPSSFQDSDGDGLGDLKGIQSRLDHLVDAGIKTFWMSPMFKSPMADLGYDVSDYRDINKLFGTMDDFKQLVADVKAKGLHVMLDYVPNHTSDEHEWFQKSIKKIDPYTNYYKWRDGIPLADGNFSEPNNWISVFGGSSWSWVPERKQFYYHAFAKKQPDLNFRNLKVREEMIEVMRFWLDLGVDGFRMDAVNHLMEDPTLTNEAYVDEQGDKKDYMNLYHNYTQDWPETYDLILEWRKFLDDYAAAAESKHTRIMMTEAYSRLDYLMAYYGNETHPGVHSPFNFFLLRLPFDANATVVASTIMRWLDNMPDGCWPNWVIGNHDNPRVATRLGQEMVDGFAMMSMLLPGTSVSYQGEEIGQTDTLLRSDQIRDPQNDGHGVARDPQRGPFLWDASENAGFTSRKRPWEPINPSYWRMNLASQKAANVSHYKVYQQLAKLRHYPTIQFGTLETHAVSKWVFAFVRRLAGNDTIVVVLNMGSELEVVVLGEEIPGLAKSLTVHIPSLNSGYKAGDIVHSAAPIFDNSKLLVLRPKASVVLRERPGDGDVTEAPHRSGAEIYGLSLISATLLLFHLAVIVRT